MNIALAHFRVGETDGVSLEMEKWRKELEEMGHKVIYISGTEGYGEVCIPEINLRRNEFKKWENNAYVKLSDYEDESEFEKDVDAERVVIEEKLRKAIEDYEIDMIIPNNIFSLGIGYPVSIAFKNIIEEYNLKVISHNHDFYWERPYFDNPTCSLVKKWQNEIFPPHGEKYQQVVINKIAQKQLKERKGLDSTVVPNVFDFHAQKWGKDEYNSDFRKNLGLSEQDIVFLQATRVSERKAIELAVEVIGEIKRKKESLFGELYSGKQFTSENRIVFLMPGMIESLSGYPEFLNKVAEDEDVEILWINEIMDFQRDVRNGKKIYSLWDTYVNSDFITYPSVIEGWGNQFLEGLFAKKPMLVFEYPVYVSDIKPLGFETVSLGQEFEERIEGKQYVKIPQNKIESAAIEIIDILKDREKYSEIVERNFMIGKENLSYQSLRNILEKLVKKSMQE